MKAIIAGTWLLTGLLAAAAPARAGTITDVELYGETVTFGANSVDFAGQSVLAGQILLTTDHASVIDAWCIDLFHDVYLGGGQSLTYVGQTLNGASNGDGGVLSALQAQEIAGLVVYGNALIAAGGNVDQAAGIQMAIWATEYAGVTFVPSAAQTDELAYLQLAPNLYGNAEALVSGTGGQELVGETNQIPEPASMAALGAGLLGLLAFRRRPG